jgi:hypothetical protein
LVLSSITEINKETFCSFVDFLTSVVGGSVRMGKFDH